MPSRRTLLQTAAWAAALGAGSGVGTAATVPAVGHPSRLVGAHYYPWYGPERHWDEGYVGTPQLGSTTRAQRRSSVSTCGWPPAPGSTG
jgi:hypothetical protein